MRFIAGDASRSPRSRRWGCSRARPFGKGEAGARTAPPYTLSINIEIMFNTGRGNPPMPRADRIRAVAAKGFKAYSFWNAMPDERKAMIKAQQETGLKCVSLVGTGNAGGTTGFTKPGAQDALLAEIKERVEIAKEFGTQPDLITFCRHHPTGRAVGNAASPDCRRVEARRRHRRGWRRDNRGRAAERESQSTAPRARSLRRSLSGRSRTSTTRT